MRMWCNSIKTEEMIVYCTACTLSVAPGSWGGLKHSSLTHPFAPRPSPGKRSPPRPATENNETPAHVQASFYRGTIESILTNCITAWHRKWTVGPCRDHWQQLDKPQESAEHSWHIHTQVCQKGLQQEGRIQIHQQFAWNVFPCVEVYRCFSYFTVHDTHTFITSFF